MPLIPAKLSDSPFHDSINEKMEVWRNDLYTVFVNRNILTDQPVYDKENNQVSICWLSIKRNDRQPIFDWRDMQYIKNQLVGEECEGCQLFPAESRLVDGANQYHLWVFENKGYNLPFGWNERWVTEKAFLPNMQQRPFPDSRKPIDLKACEEKMEALMEDYKRSGILK